MKVSRTERKSLITAATANGYETMEQVIELINANPCKNSNKVLRAISGPILIDACDGLQTLDNATDVFTYIDQDFVNWGLNKPAPATEPMAVVVHEMVEDANFRKMFDFAEASEKQRYLTPHQFKNFVQNNRQWLRDDGYATFVQLLKDYEKPATSDNIFVAYVYVNDDGLLVYVHKFEFDSVWDAEYRHRCVIPQLTV